MCRAGGPRCNGSRRTATTTGSVATLEPVADVSPEPAPKSNVPDRDETDRLAAALSADRTGWDGQPLNESGRRLYALRESGYTGPINQDGYPETTGEGADILRRMAAGRGEVVDW